VIDTPVIEEKEEVIDTPVIEEKEEVIDTPVIEEKEEVSQGPILTQEEVIIKEMTETSIPAGEELSADQIYEKERQENLKKAE